MAGKQASQSGSIIYRTHTERTQESVSTTLLLAMDEVPGFDIDADQNRLFDYVDADALDAVFASTPNVTREQGTISFPVADYDITVQADGEIIIRE